MQQAVIIDDDRDMANAIKLMFKLLDLDGIVFTRPREGATYLLNAPKLPALAIVDLNMPEVTGWDVLEFIRRHPRLKDLPVIILTYETYPRFVEQAKAAGADAYLSKPVTLEELEATVQKVLSARRAS